MTFETNIFEMIWCYGVLLLWSASLFWANKRLTDRTILKLKNNRVIKVLKKRTKQPDNKYVQLGKNVYVQERYLREAEK